MNNVYTIPEPISVMINFNEYKQSDITEIKRLVKEQIKINNMMQVGKNMIHTHDTTQNKNETNP